MEQDGQLPPDQVRRTQQVDNAIRAIQEKKPVPEIDFTIHTMEDGTQVSTLERVCKGQFKKKKKKGGGCPTHAFLSYDLSRS